VADNFTSIWNRLLLRSPAIGPGLAQDLVKTAFAQLVDRRDWSWLRKASSFYPAALYNTGTVTVTADSTTVTGAGTTFTAAMAGRQIRVGATGGSNYPTYTILKYISATEIELDRPWSGPTQAALAYELFTCYFSVPTDLHHFYAIVNSAANYRVWHNVSQSELAVADPQRFQSGLSYAASFLDYTPTYSGKVAAVLQVRGTGPAPVSVSSYGYTYPANSVYTVEITTGGAPGGALVFKWKKDSGAYTTAVAVPDSNALDLSNGVQIYFPADTYILGDVFIIQCTAETVPSVARYEMWPRPVNSQYVYPYIYVMRLDELTDEKPNLPQPIGLRGDVLLEMALEKCAQFPGTETTRNPYYDLVLARQHGNKAETLIYEMEKRDDDIAETDLTYWNLARMPVPWLDGAWQQQHAPILW